jgi:hypothetical protein
MTISQWIVLILTIASVWGCTSKKDDDSVVASRGGRGTPGISNPTTNTNSTSTGSGVPNGTYEGQSWGEVYCPDSSQQDSFMQSVFDLVSSTMSPDLLGYVSCTHADTTGVRFKGYIEVDSSGNVVTSNSTLRLIVWDSEAGTQTSVGQTIPEYPIDFSRAQSGTVQGSHADLVFSDDYGDIRFSGNFDQTYFRGTMSFTNRRSFDNSTPRSGTFPGEFVVKTCGFFRCK